MQVSSSFDKIIKKLEIHIASVFQKETLKMKIYSKFTDGI